jgi:hypothetical protein
MPDAEKTCFVIMPISDPQEYQPGHFQRVYKHLIAPACSKSGFMPVRADDIARTNYIVLDILRRIIDSDLVVCDLSGRNPNVLYELGIRQAFNKPVALIKDEGTERVFDIQGFRYTEYSVSLRIDAVETEVEKLAKAFRDTATGAAGEVNSLVQLLGIEAATLPQKTALSNESSLVLKAVEDVRARLVRLEDKVTERTSKAPVKRKKLSEISEFQDFVRNDAPTYALGETFYDGKAKEFGVYSGQSPAGEYIFKGRNQTFQLDPTDPMLDELSAIPF